MKKTEAIQMVTEQYRLSGKVIIPIRLQNQVGKTTVSGTFYVYDDDELAKKHVNPTIFTRLERLNKGEESE